ncbi:MAG: hypothetical protein ACTS2F_22785 [Thainema sp.]
MSSESRLIVADAHVHIYDCFNLDQFLDASYQNFSQIAARQDNQLPFLGVLFLTETIRDRYFQKLSQLAAGKSTEALTQKWQFRATGEAESLYAYTNAGAELCIIAGRQIVTAENLEVLALGTAELFEDGQPIDNVVDAVHQAGGLPVIPWGFGKWIGRRGTVLTELLEAEQPTIFLGDNSGRPLFWKRPPYFETVEKKGLCVLPGTDPLPFTSETDRPGKYGFMMQVAIDAQMPAASLKQAVMNSPTSLKTYGSLESPVRFVRNQIAMQITKRQRRSA